MSFIASGILMNQQLRLWAEHAPLAGYGGYMASAINAPYGRSRPFAKEVTDRKPLAHTVTVTHGV